MKKLLIFLCAMVITFSLVACGEKAAPTQAPETIDNSEQAVGEEYEGEPGDIVTEGETLSPDADAPQEEIKDDSTSPSMDSESPAISE